jgi:glycosyltransferase involved in cell wall biosynthesis
MSKKPEIVFTFPDCMGGVASFNRNIINYSSLKNRFSTHVILIRSEEDKRTAFTDPLEADKVSRFHFSFKENQYHVCKRFNELLGSDPGCIVTDNDLTLKSVAIGNNPKTVFFLVHDYFYINYALQFEPVIDAAIAHSSFFKDILCAALPAAYSNKSFYIPYGVEQPAVIKKEKREPLNVVFLGRLVEDKGVLELKKIDDLLSAQNVVVNWTIIGSGPLEQVLKEEWSSKTNVTFAKPAVTKDVYQILQAQDIQVLPTTFEGTPVSILECMANGAVPVVSDLPGGIRDIVKEDTGFKCKVNDPGSFADAIIYLSKNREKLAELQKNCLQVAREKYDINKAADDYFDFFLSYVGKPGRSKTMHINFSRLDKPYMPNTLVKLTRNFRNK